FAARRHLDLRLDHPRATVQQLGALRQHELLHRPRALVAAEHPGPGPAGVVDRLRRLGGPPRLWRPGYGRGEPDAEAQGALRTGVAHAQLHADAGLPGRAHGDRLDLPAVDLGARSEEHTSELQSRFELVCRLLLEKKNLSFKTIIVT